MKQAGYAESTSKQQTVILDKLRNNSVMQKALREHGFDETFIAKEIMDGIGAQSYFYKDGDMSTVPDHNTRHRYLKTGAELLDAFPAQKKIEAQVGVEQILDNVEQSTDYAEWDTVNKQKPEEEKSDS